MGGFPEDPDLKPVAAAQAALEGAERAAAPAPRSGVPVIEPLLPDAWVSTVALQHALKVDGHPVEILSLRMLKGRDITNLVLADDPDYSLNLRARALVCGVHPEVLINLASVDMEAVAIACRPFLPESLLAADNSVAEALVEDALSREG